MSTQVVFTINDILSAHQIVHVGGTTMPLFGQNGKLKRGLPSFLIKLFLLLHFFFVLTFNLGRQKLSVWGGMEGCGSVNTKTPGLAVEKTPMDKIDKLIKKYETQEIPRVDWLDKFVGKSISIVHEESSKNPAISLFITLPDFKYPVVYYQKVYYFVRIRFSFIRFARIVEPPVPSP